MRRKLEHVMRKRATVFLLIPAAAMLVIGCAAAQDPSTNQTQAPKPLFVDSFKRKPGPGWYWLREHKEAWRCTERGLEVLIEPGNMWGPQNDARNVLLRPAPTPATDMIIIEVTFEHSPTNQYEQADLVWYLDDSNMVKLGEELVDGKLSVVMGREEKDKTRTVSITPLISNQVHLRMEVTRELIAGSFQIPGKAIWTPVGQCELPHSAQPGATSKIGFQFYQGVLGSGHWAQVSDFRISSAKPVEGKTKSQ